MPYLNPKEGCRLWGFLWLSRLYFPMSQVMESKARQVLHKLSSCHQQEIGEEAAWEDEGVEAAFPSWLETPTGSSRDWDPSERLVQLLQQVWQDWVCQSYEPPEHGACLLGTQEIQALPSQAHCQGFQLAARDSGQRPQSFLSLAERSDLGCQVCWIFLYHFHYSFYR